MQFDTTAVLIFGTVWLGTLIATIVALKKDIKGSEKEITDVKTSLARVDARCDVMDAHRFNAAIHQESMSVREIQQNFDNLREGQAVMSARLKDHVEDDRRDQELIRRELSAIRNTQNEEFKIIRETLEDFRDRLPRFPIPRNITD